VKYVCLIYMPTDFDPAPEQRKVLGSEYERLNATLDGREDVVRARLSEAHTATTVRLRDGQRLLSDGPFAEAKEVLAGFYLIDCKDLDEALDYAGRIPGARHGAVEVRPVVEEWDPARETWRF
jgi:hypothetical protein